MQGWLIEGLLLTIHQSTPTKINIQSTPTKINIKISKVEPFNQTKLNKNSKNNDEFKKNLSTR